MFLVFREEHRLNARRFKSFPAPPVRSDLNYRHRVWSFKRFVHKSANIIVFALTKRSVSRKFAKFRGLISITLIGYRPEIGMNGFEIEHHC